MIDNIDDILHILKTSEEKDQFIKLIHREDNLTDLLYQLTDAGYSPGINFEAGRITALKLEFNKRLFLIETQQLIKSAVEGVVVVDDEATYNNMSQAMTALNNKLFLKATSPTTPKKTSTSSTPTEPNPSAASSVLARLAPTGLETSLRST